MSGLADLLRSKSNFFVDAMLQEPHWICNGKDDWEQVQLYLDISKSFYDLALPSI